MLNTVLVIGSGPIIIGQAAEFDYSGSQACRVLKEEGIRVVLINNNPATIMTDKSLADAVYSEPLTVEFARKIIEKEKPDALLAGMGGQTALNLSLELYKQGVLKENNVKMIGASIESIDQAEDREKFKTLMESIGQPCLESQIATNFKEAKEIVKVISYPIVVRPAFTLGGTGGGFCYNESELETIVDTGLAASASSQVLIEKSIKGWKEIEYEMMRDHKGNTIVVCNMENFDPVGIHTGDSIVVAPSQTLTDYEYQMLRRASIDIVQALDIVGGCNVQLALDPVSHNYFVIEVNPRVSRSSALASKATGYPIAKVATKIALGYALDEISNDVTKKTKACFEPVLDYCALKIPKWPFNKFKDAKRVLGTQMMATGEIMSLANNFEAALLKGIRSLEINQDGLYNEQLKYFNLAELFDLVVKATDERLFYLAELIRREVGIKKLNAITAIDLFFLKKIEHIVKHEQALKSRLLTCMTSDELKELKKIGFSNKHLSNVLLNGSEEQVRQRCIKEDIKPVYRMVDTCAGEFEAYSPYYYSTYDDYSEALQSNKKKILIVGSGPISIGQGVEFDYCSVHGVYTVQELGYEAILINNNPETVSTDFDISDKLYFEPITFEDVMHVIDVEQPEGVILQYGGQTAIKLAEQLDACGINILGTSYEGIHKAEDRHEFNELISSLELKQPHGTVVYSLESLNEALGNLDFPLLCRPSYVIGGQGMKIVQDTNELMLYMKTQSIEDGILLDEYLEGIEVEVDCITDGENIIIPGIMEHLELSGVHSGDSTSVYPPQSFSIEALDRLEEISLTVCRGLKAIGLVNIQYIYAKDVFYIIEVNPRASRTIPFLSKVTGVNMIELATKVMLGEPLGVHHKVIPEFVAVKVPIFSMEKITGVDVALGPEMKSTGELMSIDQSLELALKKSQHAQMYPTTLKSLFISISDRKKASLKGLMKLIKDTDISLYATAGTAKYLTEYGLKVTTLGKLESSSIIIEKIKAHEFDMVINVPSVGSDTTRDGFKIRRQAIESRVQSFSSIEAATCYLKAEFEDRAYKIVDICTLS